MYSAQKNLRKIIDALELRYQHFEMHPSPNINLSDEEPMKLDLTSILGSHNTPRLINSVDAASRLHEGLMALARVVKDEAQVLQRALNREKNARLAINCLPVEVLSRIFEDACSSNSAPFGTLSDSRPLHCIMSICERWRQVAVGTSSLWTQWNISLDPSNALFMLPSQFFKGISRAKGRPLHIRLDYSGSSEPSAVDNMLGHTTVLKAEVLEVSAQVSGRRKLQSRVKFCPDKFPNLRSLRLRVATLIIPRTYTALSYAHLRHLCLVKVQDDGNVLKLIRWCTTLETLVWHEAQRIINFQGRPLISLRFLTRLDLDSTTYKLLSILQAPSLRHLNMPHFDGITLHRFPHLLNLELLETDSGTRPTPSQRFIQLHESLESLTLGDGVSPSMVECLGARSHKAQNANSPPFVLPRLSVVRAEVCDREDLENVVKLFELRENWRVGDPRRADRNSECGKLEFHVLDSGNDDILADLKDIFCDQIVHDEGPSCFGRWYEDGPSPRSDEWVDCFK